MARRGLAIIFTLLGVAFVISIGGFVLLYMLVGRQPSVPTNGLLVQRIGGSLAEVEPADVFGYIRGTRSPTVRGIVDNLRKAKVDRRVSAVLIKPTGLDTPFWAKIQEIREAMLDYRKSGKPLYAYLESGGDRDYYLASAADRVFLQPSSTVDLVGVATYEVFLRGTLDKLDVYPDMHHIGNYKTAVNTFTEKGYTPAHKEMDQALTKSLYDQLVSGVAVGRRKTEEEVRGLIDQGPFLPEDALRAGLIDDVAYEDEVMEKLGAGSSPQAKRRIDGDEYARLNPSSLGLNRGPRVAVIYADGAIASGRSRFDPVNGGVVGSDTLIEYIRQARRDTSVKAIVLRIDSPGGSASASDAIWRELMVTRREREDRPLVASMSDLAASGGYYLAMAAQSIVAQPATLTGSIGIFGGKFVTGGLYEKLGAHIDSTSIGKNAEIGSPARPFNQQEIAKLQEQLQSFYDEFVEKVAAARHTTPEKIDQIAQGRVWTGAEAVERGLVDSLGGLQRAIDVAKEKAKIAADRDVEIVVYPPKRSFYELLANGVSGNDETAVSSWVAANLSSGELEMLRAMRGPSALFRRGEPLALMPFTFLR